MHLENRENITSHFIGCAQLPVAWWFATILSVIEKKRKKMFFLIVHMEMNTTAGTLYPHTHFCFVYVNTKDQQAICNIYDRILQKKKEVDVVSYIELRKKM